MSKRHIENHLATTLVKLFAEPATAQEIGASPVEMHRLEKIGLIKRRGYIRTGRRGRPAIVWALPKNTRAKVARRQARA